MHCPQRPNLTLREGTGGTVPTKLQLLKNVLEAVHLTSICSTILLVQPTAERPMSTAGTNRRVLRSGCHGAAAASASMEDGNSDSGGQVSVQAYSMVCSWLPLLPVPAKKKYKNLLQMASEPHLPGLSMALEVFWPSHQPYFTFHPDTMEISNAVATLQAASGIWPRGRTAYWHPAMVT